MSTTPRPAITDGQIHVWRDHSPQRPWPPAVVQPHRIPALGVGELLDAMDAAGVGRAVLVPPTWEGPRNDYVLAAAAAHPHRFGALCRFDVNAPAFVAGLGDWRRTTGMLGIRMSINRGDIPAQFRTAIGSGFFAAAQEHGVPLSIYSPGAYRQFAMVAARFPALRVTVDHLGLDSAMVPLRAAVAPLLDLAKYPGIAVKASALPCFVGEDFPFPSVIETIYALVDTFGPERVFFGSDLTRLPCRYEQWVDVVVNHLPRLSEAERAQLLGGAISAWLDWPELATEPANKTRSVPR
jgi:predicted TIM-barrel fold metal-dependent hydrolase